ncbi:uncharacterized protein BO87DRAFT_322441 [Aspergillus neoniger CBS 115656]|uniref:Helicase C-terminal domain-containing protein n=1 Tax=Aspergillus neoniger (strain CBS 115656) TaxID=1448310 RepID=A0A318Y4G7_ASPNB|nr:hypothetical protein BO87DRAFT_322441 [Aspergillus neoniger CBS 115656]PYH28337.1 hypothetical protein BO87DRAFT_322441 [Aspergillus neoniger CBS 115656]
MSPEEHARVIADFTSPGTGVAVLLTTFATGAVGLNLQTECSRIIVAEPGKNLNAIIQALGRAHRTGQKQKQKAWILTQQRSINMFVESRNMMKALPQIAADLHHQLKGVINNLEGIDQRGSGTEAHRKPGTNNAMHRHGKSRLLSRKYDYSGNCTQ